MEMNILYAIQGIHNTTLDSIMVFIFNDLVGDKGQIWVIIGIMLMVIPKTRKCGICVLTAYIVNYYIGDGLLKDFFARPRPCAIDESVELIIKRSTSYSFPSVHSALAFGSAGSIYFHYKKAGIFALIMALLVGFSRMYFFVHYPTDVLAGSIMGFFISYLVYRLSKKCW